MLVLTRKAGEAICIGDDIELRIVSVRGQKVRLAIEAPREVSVRRSELRDEATQLSGQRLARENQPARTGSSQRRAVG
jgi:carbon storage regulator